LENYGISLKDACATIKKKLGTGANVNKEESTIDIQGDVTNDVMDLILQQTDWKIPEDCVQFLSDGKKVKSRSGGGNARPKGASSRSTKAHLKAGAE